LQYLESSDSGEQIAIYMLGKELSMVQDFSGKRATAAQAVRKWDPKDLSVLIQNTENMDAVDRGMQCGVICEEIRTQTTSQAIAKIAQNLSNIPGRKSLIWVSDTPAVAGAQFLGPANIPLYPVLARGVGTSGVVGWLRDNREQGRASSAAPAGMAGGTEIERQRANAVLAAANGGVAFADSRDISTAIRTAIEDAGNTYVLGFYPAEDTLDNKFHMLTVEMGKKAAARGRMLDVRYRPGYLAARAGAPAVSPENGGAAAASIALDGAAGGDRPTLNQLLQSPPGTSKLHLTAELSPDTEQADSGGIQVRVHIDAHDLAPEHANEWQSIGVDVSFLVEGSGKVLTKTLKFQIPDGQFAAFLEKGIDTVQSIDATGGGAVLRVVVQDRVTGTAGSVTIRLSQR
jgi:VWFA-related protein